MILEPQVGQRVFYHDPTTNEQGWGNIKKVHGPRFVTLEMDHGPDLGAWTSELSPEQTPTPGKGKA